MITLRRSSERGHQHRAKRDVWLTFGDADKEGSVGGFGTLKSLDEGLLGPGAKGARQRHSQGDIVTYVREGVLAYVNSMGQAGVVHAGEFHRRIATSQLEHREANGSHADSAHVFRIGLCNSAAETEPSHEQTRFSVADRRDGLCIVASSDARRGSLHIHNDALVYSAILHAGQHVVHELDVGRCAWLHVVHGEVCIDAETLTTGDGAGVTGERALSLTARVDSEILLLDLAVATVDPSMLPSR